VSTGLEPFAEVTRDRSDVGAAGAAHGHVHVDAVLGLAELVHLDRVDPDRPGLELELLTGAHALVGTPAVDLDRRDVRGHLVDRAHERAQGSEDGLLGEAVGGGSCHELALGVVGRGGGPEPDGGVVHLVGQEQVAEQPGGPVDAEHQHPRRHRVERAGVAHLPGAGETAYLGDDVVRGHP
jgi:hypothetical protein